MADRARHRRPGRRRRLVGGRRHDRGARSPPRPRRTSRPRTTRSCAARPRSAGRRRRPCATPSRCDDCGSCRVRLPAGGQALGHPRAPRDGRPARGAGSCPGCASRGSCSMATGRSASRARPRPGPADRGADPRPDRASRGPRPPAPGPRPAGRRRRRRPAHAGRPRGLRPGAPGDRAPPAHPPGDRRADPAAAPGRGLARSDAGRAQPRVRRRRSTAARATPSSPRRRIPACSRWPCRGSGPRTTPPGWPMPGTSACSSRSPATAARAARRRRARAGSGSTTGSMRPGSPRSATPWPAAPAWRWASDALDIVVPGTRPALFRGEGTSERRRSSGSSADLAAFDFRPNQGTVLSAHQMGTARMGADPDDPRVRSAWAASGAVPATTAWSVACTSPTRSLFPTGLGVNPMLTVMALARRVVADGAGGGLTGRPPAPAAAGSSSGPGRSR